MSEKPVAYYRGKYFDSVEEMMEYAQKWSAKVVDQESMKSIIDMMSANIFHNSKIHFPNMTNMEMMVLCEKLFYEALRQLFIVPIEQGKSPMIVNQEWIDNLLYIPPKDKQ